MDHRLAPRVCPTGGEHDRTVGGQPFEPGITTDLTDPFESCEMRLRPLSPAVRAIEIDCRRRVRAIPRSIVSHVNPQPSGLGSAAARLEDRDLRVVGE
jgi:hypothetical protein